MKVTLWFTKQHTAGILAGLKTEHTLTFVSMESAATWIDGARRNERRNGWKLASHSFQKASAAVGR